MVSRPRRGTAYSRAKTTAAPRLKVPTPPTNRASSTGIRATKANRGSRANPPGRARTGSDAFRSSADRSLTWLVTPCVSPGPAHSTSRPSSRSMPHHRRSRALARTWWSGDGPRRQEGGGARGAGEAPPGRAGGRGERECRWRLSLLRGRRRRTRTHGRDRVPVPPGVRPTACWLSARCAERGVRLHRVTMPPRAWRRGVLGLHRLWRSRGRPVVHVNGRRGNAVAMPSGSRPRASATSRPSTASLASTTVATSSTGRRPGRRLAGAAVIAVSAHGHRALILAGSPRSRTITITNGLAAAIWPRWAPSHGRDVPRR